jgi:hypothetical protein
MICLDCVHSITRAYTNGQYVEREVFCDIDGLRIIKNVTECSRYGTQVRDGVDVHQRESVLEVPDMRKADIRLEGKIDALRKEKAKTKR